MNHSLAKRTCFKITPLDNTRIKYTNYKGNSWPSINYKSILLNRLLFCSKVPWWIRKLAPQGSLELHEEAWNGYPFCRTVITNPDYMKEKFFIKIESLHVQDKGTLDNPFHLPPDLLSKREVVVIDIANDPVSSGVSV